MLSEQQNEPFYFKKQKQFLKIFNTGIFCLYSAVLSSTNKPLWSVF